jgi:hypothetical protein
VALSRLANPELQVRAVQPRKAGEVTAEKPLRVTLSVARPDGGFKPGQPVVVRGSATAEAYVTVIRVSEEGKAVVAYRSPMPTRSFACVIRSGTDPGTEYVIAAAVAHAGEAAAALRAAGAGSVPPAAWNAAVAAAGGGGRRRLQRFEWDTGSASFVIPAPAPPAGPEKAAPDDKREEPSAAPAPKPPVEDPGPDRSVLPEPGAPKPGPAEKPVETRQP